MNAEISLRDYIATHIMAAYRSHNEYANDESEKVARWSYVDADALLRVRAENNER